MHAFLDAVMAVFGRSYVRASVRRLRKNEEDLPDGDETGKILMDVQLPEVDGLTLTRELRLDPRLATVPIIAVTAYAMARDRLAAMDAGCDAFVSKPIDTQALGDLVTELLRHGRNPL